MSWRTVVISNRCKLDLKLGYMVIRGDEIRRVFLDEIAVVILENPAVSLTGCLLDALVEKKIRMILCGNNMMLVHPDLDSVFHFAEDRVWTLVIENQDFFRSFLADLSAQISGIE